MTTCWCANARAESGRDTRLIGFLYRVHSLEWFGEDRANLALRITALSALAVLLVGGLVLLGRPGQNSQDLNFDVRQVLAFAHRGLPR